MEEVAHLDQRPHRAAARGDAQDAAAVGLQASAFRGAALAGFDAQPRNRGDARQRLAANPSVATREVLDGGVCWWRDARSRSRSSGGAAAVVATRIRLAGARQVDAICARRRRCCSRVARRAADARPPRRQPPG
jgi:hypothetical protein